MKTSVDFLPCGDTGLTVQFGANIDRSLSRRVVHLSRVLSESGIPGLIESVPTYRSLLIHYDPLTISQKNLIANVETLLESHTADDVAAGKAFRLPVCFDGPDFAPDLQNVAKWANATPEAVINAIVSNPLYVYMIGFAPGQPYLGDLPDWLAIPRRENPVANIPAGSVVIATGKAVIYPFDNPTGWHVVGRTPARLFNHDATPPALLAAGDTVELHTVDYDEFRALENAPHAAVELRPSRS